MRIPELLAPAGEPDAGYAALHYGADAVYLGLSRFSARAEAVNFTPEQLAEFVGYAHSLTPRRRVYLTLNTLIKQNELASAAETLAIAVDCGVDAIIVQDPGVAELALTRFPGLELHASTQMAIHSLGGAMAAKRLGFSRVTLARELTLAELAGIAADSGVEIEAFIHGTLCYSYSGLCLFSSLATGRSGNRGRCVYSCREAVASPDGSRTHPFSLKDLALGLRILDLAKAGVACLKIEGRKKSPLYVAATVDYYRKILDGKMTEGEAAAAEARLKTIFARPWTTLFLDGKYNPEAADPEVVGHRGSGIGSIDSLIRTPSGPGLRFMSSLPVERHDGIQIDIPGEARPFGFGVDNLYLIQDRRLEPVFAAPAGEMLAVALPPDSPRLKPGLPLYLASSQAVKRGYPFFRPKVGAFQPRRNIDIAVSLRQNPDFPSTGPTGFAACEATCGDTRFHFEEAVDAFPARDEAGAEAAAKGAFSRAGDGFMLAGWRFANPNQLFVRPGDWNRLRRRLLENLTEAVAKKQAAELAALVQSLETSDGLASGASRTSRPAGVDAFRWSLFADDPASLSRFGAADFSLCAEVVVGIGASSGGTADNRLEEQLARLADIAGGDKIRLAPPLILRPPDSRAMAARVERLWQQGWRKWLIPGLAAWRQFAERREADLAADWTIPVLNRLAAERLAAMGIAHFTLSPEDEAANLASLLRGYADRAWLVAYTDAPLFISAACAHAHLGHCQKGGSRKSALPARCSETGKELHLSLERSGGVAVGPTRCGSVVTGATPYSLLDRLGALRESGAQNLRLDLRWKNHPPEQAIRLWRQILAGQFPVGTPGNFTRGLL